MLAALVQAMGAAEVARLLEEAARVVDEAVRALINDTRTHVCSIMPPVSRGLR